MNFILDEAKDYSQALQFSDEQEIENDAEDFINDEEISEEGVSFSRERNTSYLNNYYKFNNQTRDPRKAIFEDSGIFLESIVNQNFLFLRTEKVLILISFKVLKNMHKTSKILCSNLIMLKITCFILLYMV